MRGKDGFGVEFGQQKIQAGEVGDAGLLGVHRLQDRLSDGFRVWVFGLGYKFEA